MIRAKSSAPHLGKSSSPRLPPTVLVALVASLVLSASVAHAAKSIYAPIADGFDYPVGKPDADGYRKARGFWPNGHLGEDWNGRGGGNTDLGDPVYSIGHGVVVYSDDFKMGWGNVVIIRHAYREKTGRVHFIDSLYGHLDVRLVKLYQKVRRGEKIGTIGRGPRNMYYAHLHFEIRKNLAIGMNRSKYPRDYSCYHSPTNFIRSNRSLRAEHRAVRMPVDTFLQEVSDRLTAVPATVPPPSARSTDRPKVPTAIQEVIRTRSTEPPEKRSGLRSFWMKLKAQLQREYPKD